jgi:hypothetical protein
VIAPEIAMLAGPKPKPTRSKISEVAAMKKEEKRRGEVRWWRDFPVGQYL